MDSPMNGRGDAPAFSRARLPDSASWRHGCGRLAYPVLVGDDKVAKDYGNVEVVPTTFIIDRAGNIVQKIVGSRSKDDFLKIIRPLL